ncbi:hypothetical protein B0A48_08021 [Cryoendolithus antarcticus]|uniref:proline--tRNA ligase n=1 Tax=Cryoendolithus antarcticus TaxID=1507870 RepID=A0A1V8T1E7_9PEZI|nr:hypothetical protein B0A48_08021 [Cryoendolithus antarcticus]
MRSLGASKVSLSSLSSEELWRKSGRLEGRDSEFLRLQDRKGAKYLLSPTHEEEITSIVANAVKSHKDLPLRLYQVSRKYRDEARPRQGLLRGREFLMKDLYTFDVTDQQARATYEQVRNTYKAFLDELRLPYLVANADSGNMGGDLSHEYHFVSDRGEDNVIHCTQCDYSINEELFIGAFERSMAAPLWSQISESINGGEEIERVHLDQHGIVSGPCQSTVFMTKDRRRRVQVVTPRDGGVINIYAVKALVPDVDTSIMPFENSIIDISGDFTLVVDQRLALQVGASRLAALSANPSAPQPEIIYSRASILTLPISTTPCPTCRSQSLKLSKAIEIGHTFHLGTRYSEPLSAQVLNSENKLVPVSMGCHGIGVSRLIGAAASLLLDDKGLNWPLLIAPFSAVIVPGPQTRAEDVSSVYDALTQQGPEPMDAVVDDRKRSLGWKLKDADLVGYPFIMVLGKAWSERREVEMQCRRLGVKETVSLLDLGSKLDGYSKQL